MMLHEYGSVNAEYETKEWGLQSAGIGAEYDVVFYSVDLIGCKVRDIHDAYDKMPGVLADTHDSAWDPQMPAEQCVEEMRAKISESVGTAQKQFIAIVQNSGDIDKNYKPAYAKN
jgi:hypothetical protein